MNSASSVLFVCSGNTCRSAMAAAFTRHICSQSGIELQVRSAGTAAVSGKKMTPVAGDVLLNHGVDSEHTSQKLTREMLLEHDRVFVMELKHLELCNNLLESSARKKLRLFDQPKEIPDPLGESREVYESLALLLIERIHENIVQANDFE